MALPLPTLVVASPCSEPWAEMRRDGHVRFCGRCQNQVFDLSAMAASEVAELVSDPTRSPCVRFYRRTDGRVMTADCPVGLRAIVWRLLRRRAAWAASLFAMLALPACRTATQGLVPADYADAVASLHNGGTAASPASDSTPTQ